MSRASPPKGAQAKPHTVVLETLGVLVFETLRSLPEFPVHERFLFDFIAQFSYSSQINNINKKRSRWRYFVRNHFVAFDLIPPIRAFMKLC